MVVGPMKPSFSFGPVARRTCLLLAISLLLPACAGGKEPLVTVSGKTAYGEMAIEEVWVRALIQTESGWIEQAVVRSGYHGSFVVDLPPGRYRLEAKGRIFSYGTEIPLSGSLEPLEVPAGTKRIDRVRIELGPLPKGG